MPDVYDEIALPSLAASKKALELPHVSPGGQNEHPTKTCAPMMIRESCQDSTGLTLRISAERELPIPTSVLKAGLTAQPSLSVVCVELCMSLQQDRAREKMGGHAEGITLSLIVAAYESNPHPHNPS
eukprot:scaffold67270_cov20-Tisochrysis_lutea.AAC.1